MKRVLLLAVVLLLSANPPTLLAMSRPAQQRLAAKMVAKRAEWRGMDWQQKVAQAQRIYNQTWKAAAPLMGAGGQPAPKMVVVPRSQAPEDGGITMPNEGSPYVELPPSTIRALAKPKILRGPHGAFPKTRAAGRETLLHEFAHTRQNSALLEDPNTNHAEEAAQLFASYEGHKLFGAPASMGRRGPLPYANRPAASRDLASIYGKGYWRRGQFLP